MITAMTKFEEFVGTAMGQGTLDPKTKQLVGLAAALGSGWSPWTEMTLAGARQTGASQQEIEEVAAVAMAVSAFKTNSLFASKLPAE